MLIVMLWLASFLLLFVDKIGIPVMVIIWGFLGYWAYQVYIEGLNRYANYLEVQQNYKILKRKRLTILENMLGPIENWSNFEKEILAKAGDTSVGTQWLMQRYPNIQSTSMFRSYLEELKNIEEEINMNLRERVKRAADWFIMKDNLAINLFMPRPKRGEVPEDLRGDMFDATLPNNGYGDY